MVNMQNLERNQNRSVKDSMIHRIDLGRLILSLPADVNKKLSLHDLKRICDNYEAGVKPGDFARVNPDSEFSYEVACIKRFPHGIMIGIYDEPPGKHVDFWNPGSVFRVNETKTKESKEV